MDLNEEHLKSIANEIHLNHEMMHADRSKGQALAYLDEKFAFLNGKHNVENLIIMGWLLCKHWSDETQTTELWHICNPTLMEEVPTKQVLAVIKKLLYVSIDLNKKMVESLPKSPEQKNALKYHERIFQNRQKFLEQLNQQLGRSVVREQIAGLAEIFKSYDLRMTVAGDKELDGVI